MKVGITSIGINAWYPEGIARLRRHVEKLHPEIHLATWTNALPNGIPRIVEDGYDYSAYVAKPFAVRALHEQGCDIGIWVDAAFWPIRKIHPLIEYISDVGYYFCRNGFNVGEWCADSALGPLNLGREESFGIPELSSYCLGLDFRKDIPNRFIDAWCRYAEGRTAFIGKHTAGILGGWGRNPGFVSIDPRVKGHRHDQTVASVIAWRLGMTKMVDRPRFTAYLGDETEETVLVNNGGIGNLHL